MAVDNQPEALVACSSSPATDNEKIVANIMELHKPTATIVQAASIPAPVTDTTINTTAAGGNASLLTLGG